jgi:hypothetical protein
LFKETDLVSYINEGIDRIGQIIPDLALMSYLTKGEDVPLYLPKAYHHLLAVYGTARAMEQDERHYQGSTFMNEFEVKLHELKDKIDSGDIVLVDEYGDVISTSKKPEYVYDNYFKKKNYEYEDEVV